MMDTFDSVRMDSMGQAAEREADKIRQAPLYAAISRPPPRSRGHTYSSSMSSDFDRPGTHGPPSKQASPTYKSRRSNSSSNFNKPQPTKQRRAQPPTSKYNGQGRGGPSNELEPKRNHSTPTNTSTGHHRDESDNSIADLGYDAVLESSRLAFNGRSISMDHIYAEANGRTASMMSRGRPVPSMHSKYETPLDAAPEPNIAAGPRKQQNPSAMGPVYVNAAQKQSALRKTTTQSDLRTVNGTTVPQSETRPANSCAQVVPEVTSRVLPAATGRHLAARDEKMRHLHRGRDLDSSSACLAGPRHALRQPSHRKSKMLAPRVVSHLMPKRIAPSTPAMPL
jgi:hypothetical protein